MGTITHDELHGHVRELAPLIREHADASERERRLAPPVLGAMRSAGLFRMMAPRSLGGLEIDPLTCAGLIEEVAQIDSAAAWALCNTNSVAWWCSRLPPAGVDEIYASGADTILAAAFHPPLEATPAAGGVRLTGRRPLASVIHDSSWVMLTGMVMEEGQPRLRDDGPEVVAAFVPTASVAIADTWYTLGMRGTDSNDVSVDGVFVPASRCYALAPDAPIGPRYGAPLYRISAMAEVSVISVPVFLGIARQAIDLVRGIAQAKTPFGSARVLRERAAAQARVARAEALLRAARLLFYETVRRDWERAAGGVDHSLVEKADALLAAVHAVDSAVQAVDLVYSLAGTTGIYTKNGLERHFRDVHTLRHHGFVCESRYETVGQVYLGVAPEFGLVAF